MSVLDGPLVLVDIETNGLSYSRCRIIEIAAIRVDNCKVVSSLRYLLNPGTPIPDFITALTGITNNDLARAPEFADIAAELSDILDGAVFIAHNVRFDYSFIKHEFARLARKFDPDLLCTVKLSRAMYPAERGHKLQDLINRCQLNVGSRHRAYDDALAIWQFICHIRQNFPLELIDKAIARQLKSPSLPQQLPPGLTTTLPPMPGVYIFEDERGHPLYIGKSVNIKKRVLSHFSADHASQTEFKIAQSVVNIEVRVTGGELEALLLESRLIKDLQPLYNRQLRRNQKLTLARRKLNSSGYISLVIEDVAQIEPEQLDDVMSVYTTKGKARQFLTDLCKTYGLCPQMLGLEKGRGPCFSYQIKKCRGACAGKQPAEEFNALINDIFDNKRLRGWPHASPILVEEQTAGSDDYHALVIDKWCVIADISQPENCQPSIRFHGKIFDIDTYRILKSYFDTKRQRLNIQPISLGALHEMAGDAIFA